MTKIKVRFSFDLGSTQEEQVLDLSDEWRYMDVDMALDDWIDEQIHPEVEILEVDGKPWTGENP